MQRNSFLLALHQHAVSVAGSQIAAVDSAGTF
jgi:hypothetical protein